MPTVFMDTSAHVAFIDRRDEWHARAFEVFEELTAARTAFVTTEAVLIELLTFLCGGGVTVRASAVEYVRRLLASPVNVVWQTSDLFERAFELYSRRPDKSYSMVDCISMVVCRDQGIAEVFTADRDFERERFRILLRR